MPNDVLPSLPIDTKEKAECIKSLLESPDYPCRDYFCELVKDKIVHAEF